MLVWRHIGGRGVIGKLQRANVRSNAPAVIGGNTRGIAVHVAETVCDDHGKGRIADQGATTNQETRP